MITEAKNKKKKPTKEELERQKMLKQRYRDTSTKERAISFKEVVGCEKDEI